MSDIELCYMTATEMIAGFKTQKISPVEVLNAQIERSENVEGKLNALTYNYFDRALENARIAEKKYMKGDKLRPLEGIPCAIKDWHSVKGEITTYGSRIFEDFKPDQSAPTVERLLDAGVIMHCRTTTPEFAHSGITHSPLWGVTRNPWNLDYNPGGSSGGAGAALAAGMTTLADGTDGGGSIRIPASASGVVGYKPPWGRNPLDREHPGETCLHYGPLTRSVADAALMQNVMSGPHSADIYSLRDRIVLPEKFKGVKDFRIGFSMDLGYAEVDQEVQKNTREASEVFKSLGCQVDEVDLDWTWDVHEAWLTNWQGLFYALSGDLLSQRRNDLDPYVVTILEAGAQTALERFYSVKRARYEMYQKLAPIFDKYDILICPTLAVPSVKADRKNDDPLSINGKEVPSAYGWLMTYPFNIISQCPVMSVPSGISETSGVPTGLQIVGRTFDDLSVFRAASAFENVPRFWQNHRPNI